MAEKFGKDAIEVVESAPEHLKKANFIPQRRGLNLQSTNELRCTATPSLLGGPTLLEEQLTTGSEKSEKMIFIGTPGINRETILKTRRDLKIKRIATDATLDMIPEGRVIYHRPSDYEIHSGKKSHSEQMDIVKATLDDVRVGNDSKSMETYRKLTGEINSKLKISDTARVPEPMCPKEEGLKSYISEA